MVEKPVLLTLVRPESANKYLAGPRNFKLIDAYDAIYDRKKETLFAESSGFIVEALNQYLLRIWKTNHLSLFSALPVSGLLGDHPPAGDLCRL